MSDGKILFAEKGKDLNIFLLNAYSFLKIEYPKFYKMDTLSKLGFLAAEVLLKDRALLKDYPAENVSLILSNSHSSLDTDIRYAESAKTLASPALFVYTLPNIVAGEICIRQKIKGENAFFVTKEFDPELLASYTSMVQSSNTQSPMPNACITGWVDVLGEHHDVFLYLSEKKNPASPLITAGQVKELYTTPLWNN